MYMRFKVLVAEDMCELYHLLRCGTIYAGRNLRTYGGTYHFHIYFSTLNLRL